MLTAASGWANARAVKRGNLGLTFAAIGGFCFALWPCISSCVEGQTQWGNAFTTQLNASAFFLVYAPWTHVRQDQLRGLLHATGTTKNSPSSRPS